MKFSKTVVLLSMLLSNTVYALPQDYELTQVLIISRHGLRAPLTDGSEMLKNATPYHWPRWSTDAGLLTTKGGALEVFMGGYFKEWFVNTGLVNKNECANHSLLVYTNTMPRTIATGQFFMDGAFPGCRVSIQTLDDGKSNDPLFYQSIKDNTTEFMLKNKASILKYVNSLNLEQSYSRLEEIIDYKQSPSCKGMTDCRLSANKNIVHLDYGKEPSISGPLHKSFLMVDAFILQNYEGLPNKDVAWGRIKDEKEWRSLAKLRNGYIEAAYLQPLVAKNIIAPLMKKVDNILSDEIEDGNKKIYVIVGHDTTIGPLLTALGVNNYELPGQYEKTPIGGKIVFQRWKDKASGRYYLKTEYIYQTTKQMRDLTPLSLQNPPEHVLLSFNGCIVNDDGLCSWNDFRKLIDNSN